MGVFSAASDNGAGLIKCEQNGTGNNRNRDAGFGRHNNKINGTLTK